MLTLSIYLSIYLSVPGERCFLIPAKSVINILPGDERQGLEIEGLEELEREGLKGLFFDLPYI